MPYTIRLIQPLDNPAIAAVIRCVSAEYGLASEQGFAVGDSVLDHLAEYYAQPNAAYWVVVDADTDQVLGGGGIAPLVGENSILEVQKMYFLPEIRRRGFAKQLLAQFKDFAHQQGFKGLYLETTARLFEATALYEQSGFVQLHQPMGATGHSHACELWLYQAISV